MEYFDVITETRPIELWKSVHSMLLFSALSRKFNNSIQLNSRFEGLFVFLFSFHVPLKAQTDEI